jgi:hypothetical protein
MNHTLHDGAQLTLMSARDLVQIPVWKGNRTLDSAHAIAIRTAIGSNIQALDNVYRIIQYDETNVDGILISQRYLIDGQHRANVIRSHFLTELCSPDFNCVVIIKTVSSESDAIDYFNAINNVKAQKWTEDPAILTNAYLAVLEKTFNTGKHTGANAFIRPKKTVRPYANINDIRDILLGLTKPQEKAKIAEFGQRALAKNAELLKAADMMILSAPSKSAGDMIKRASDVGFMLAIDTKMKWIKDVLNEMSAESAGAGAGAGAGVGGGVEFKQCEFKQ